MLIKCGWYQQLSIFAYCLQAGGENDGMSDLFRFFNAKKAQQQIGIVIPI